MLGGDTLMKTIFRVLMFGVMMSAFGAASVFAQDVCKDDLDANVALYKQFTDNFDKTIDKKQIAVDSGKQYIEKYGSCADYAAQVDYIKKSVPGLETQIATVKKQEGLQARNKAFDAAVDAGNVGEIFSTGKVILAQEPDFLDVTLAIANSGFDQIEKNPTVNTYNDDVLTYSRNGIQQIEAGKKSVTEGYGVKKYSYKTDKFNDGKSSALGSLNYNIGYILYYRQGKDNPAKKKEALPYFYKSTQYNAFSKTSPLVYQAIGAWYLDEAIRIDGERQKLLAANGNKDNDETLAMVGLQKGYADRAIDAYARAYSLSKADTKNKVYSDGLYAKLKQLYAFRYDGKNNDVDGFVATVMNKPMLDPTTEVIPVKIEAAPATTTGTTTPGAAMTSDDNTSAGTSNMGTAATAKTGNGSASKANGTAATKAATAKTPAPKPAPKKKKPR